VVSSDGAGRSTLASYLPPEQTDWHDTCSHRVRFKEVEVKTGQDVREFGLYASDCCVQEVLFDKDDSFSRCPRCLRLCEWEPVDAAVASQEMAVSNN